MPVRHDEQHLHRRIVHCELWVMFNIRMHGCVTSKKLKYISEMNQLTDLNIHNSFELRINNCVLQRGRC